MEWKTNTWTPIDNVNNGKKYQNGDGLLLQDLNAIFNNVFYIKEVLKNVGVE